MNILLFVHSFYSYVNRLSLLSPPLTLLFSGMNLPKKGQNTQLGKGKQLEEKDKFY